MIDGIYIDTTAYVLPITLYALAIIAIGFVATLVFHSVRERAGIRETLLIIVPGGFFGLALAPLIAAVCVMLPLIILQWILTTPYHLEDQPEFRLKEQCLAAAPDTKEVWEERQKLLQEKYSNPTFEYSREYIEEWILLLDEVYAPQRKYVKGCKDEFTNSMAAKGWPLVNETPDTKITIFRWTKTPFARE